MFILAQTVSIPSQLTQSTNPMANPASAMAWSVIQFIIGVMGVVVLGYGLITLFRNLGHAMAGKTDKIKAGAFFNAGSGGSVLGGVMIHKFLEILFGAIIIFWVWGGQLMTFIGATSNSGITVLHTVQNSAGNAIQQGSGTGTTGTSTQTPVCPSGYTWNGSVCAPPAAGTTGTASLGSTSTTTTAPAITSP